MEQEQLLKTGMDLVYLTRCALHGEPPQAERVEEMDLEAVHQLAKAHSMTAVSCYALEYLWGNNCEKLSAQPDVIKEWCNDKRVAIRKNIALDMEREKLLAYLEEIGCWYMPLKGSLLQELYPRAGMRQMGDNDILVDAQFRNNISAYMTGLGYTRDKAGQDYHDEYFKNPYYLFEMHTELLPKNGNRVHSRYYQNIRDRLEKDADNQMGYHFRDEDFYIYMTAHAAKHYEEGGNGIRSLMDAQVYWEKKESVLDAAYIERELTKLGLLAYEKAVKALARKLFVTGEALDATEKNMFLYHVSSGAYGCWDVKIGNRLKRYAPDGETVTVWTRVRYSLSRLFPPVEFYADYCPIAYQYKILIPFVAIWRLFASVTVNLPNFLREAKQAWKK